jgi:hypothetical protein
LKYFISYTSADQAWAEWIAWVLEKAGHSVVVQAWDFRPGSNFVLGMHLAATTSDRTLVVLSPNFLESPFAAAEWAAEFVDDPTGGNGRLIPVRVAECRPTGLLSAIVYVDLVGKSREDAVSALLSGLEGERAKPSEEPPFPPAFHDESQVSVDPESVSSEEQIEWFLDSNRAAQVVMQDLLRLKFPISPKAVVERWSSTSASRFKLLLGQDAFGRPLEFDLLADGPTGHIIGSSGTGSTRLLEAIALYTAFTFPPERLRLHLAAEVASGTWGAFSSLPNASLYDMGEASRDGLLADIRNLIAQKQVTLKESQSKDLGEHNQKVASSQLPLDLVLINELWASNEWMSQLSEIARYGRMVGVAIIPAFQSLDAIGPEFIATSRFSIALGLPNLPDSYWDRYSTEKLQTDPKNPKARPQPGRGLLLSSGHPPIPFQSMWVSDRTLRFRDSVHYSSTDLAALVEAIREATAGRD